MCRKCKRTSPGVTTWYLIQIHLWKWTNLQVKRLIFLLLWTGNVSRTVQCFVWTYVFTKTPYKSPIIKTKCTLLYLDFPLYLMEVSPLFILFINPELVRFRPREKCHGCHYRRGSLLNYTTDQLSKSVRCFLNSPELYYFIPTFIFGLVPLVCYRSWWS